MVDTVVEQFFFAKSFWGFPLWPLWLGGGGSAAAENTARGESVLLAAARFRCLRERVGTTYTRFCPLGDVESIGATSWPLTEPAPRRRALAMATRGKFRFHGGCLPAGSRGAQGAPSPRGVPPKLRGEPTQMTQKRGQMAQKCVLGPF